MAVHPGQQQLQERSPHYPGPEPVAAAATAPAAFAEAASLAAFDAEFDAETEDCFALFEIKGEDSDYYQGSE